MKGLEKKLIYLAGFMGSGKSTIGPILANILGFSFVDIDLEIEKIAGKRIKEIFSSMGEEYFREIETKLLRELSQGGQCVISLGGGTAASETNLQIIKSSGVMIYLKTNADQIFRRLKHKTDRPLLKAGLKDSPNEQELYSYIQALISKREPFYTQADMTIKTDGTRLGVTVDEIARRLKRLMD